MIAQHMHRLTQLTLCVCVCVCVYMHVCGEDALVSQHLSSTQYHIINYDHPAVR